MIGEIFNGITGLVGAGLNYAGARSANKANKKMAREQMGFQQASNREQMGFQERMSNTAYQRSVQDMKQAGINPIVAFNQGGASTPPGASSQGSKSEHKNQFAGAVSSAMAYKQLAAQIEQTKVATKLMELEIPEKQIMANLYQTPVGKILKYIKMANPLVKQTQSLYPRMSK